MVSVESVLEFRIVSYRRFFGKGWFVFGIGEDSEGRERFLFFMVIELGCGSVGGGREGCYYFLGWFLKLDFGLFCWGYFFVLRVVFFGMLFFINSIMGTGFLVFE